MDQREKERLVFIALINKQLESFNVSYEDVKNIPDWYMKYKTTKQAEQEFINWGIELIQKKLKMTKKMAKMKMDWFILQYGLTTNIIH